MLVAKLKTENIAWQIEAADLAATVAEDFIRPHTAADDLIGVVGRLAFAVSEGNDIVAPIMCMASINGFCFARSLTGETRCVEIAGRDDTVWVAVWASMGSCPPGVCQAIG